MRVTRFSDAPRFEAPGHFDMVMRRLQGREAGPTDHLWIAVSQIAPGGGTSLEASAMEKMYVVLDGEVVIWNGKEESTLRCWDSCRVEPDEKRMLRNHTAFVATILLTVPLLKVRRHFTRSRL